jgi:lipopolysaccharide/colanic/teichoic acid biosynthesis glycosyltransferase
MKRAFDLVVAAIALVLLLPVIAIVALLVRVFLGKPVLFRQTRPGLHGEPFEIIKFRSMFDEFDADGNEIPEADRVGRFGHFIRTTSLDELPELWNVLNGTMSLVGPRPLLMRYLDRYSSEQARRHDVEPGITGLAQIGGRNAISWDEKFALDVYYVDHHSFWMDLGILLKTAAKVLQREGIAAEGSSSSPEFLGSTPDHRVDGLEEAGK